MNRFEANTVEVALDTYTDTIHSLRSDFNLTGDHYLTTSHLTKYGSYYLTLIKDLLKGEIEGMKECMEDETDPEEKIYFSKLLKEQKGALKHIKKAITQIKKERKI
jgi:hypothetical protein